MEEEEFPHVHGTFILRIPGCIMMYVRMCKIRIETYVRIASRCKIAEDAAFNFSYHIGHHKPLDRLLTRTNHSLTPSIIADEYDTQEATRLDSPHRLILGRKNPFREVVNGHARR